MSHPQFKYLWNRAIEMFKNMMYNKHEQKYLNEAMKTNLNKTSTINIKSLPEHAQMSKKFALFFIVT